MTKKKAGNSWVMWTVSLVVLGLGSLYGLALGASFSEESYRTRDIGRARQVLALMKTYAADHEGHYPDHGLDVATATSNDAFRRLIKDGLTQDERLFNVYGSLFVPDNNVGTAPSYENALLPRENPWALVAGLTLKSPGHYPLMFENAMKASWPPVWRSTPRGGLVKGRIWRDGSILVGFNDASMTVVNLVEKSDGMHLPPSILKPEGKEALPTLKILDIAVP